MKTVNSRCDCVGSGEGHQVDYWFAIDGARTQNVIQFIHETSRALLLYNAQVVVWLGGSMARRAAFVSQFYRRLAFVLLVVVATASPAVVFAETVKCYRLEIECETRDADLGSQFDCAVGFMMASNPDKTYALSDSVWSRVAVFFDEYDVWYGWFAHEDYPQEIVGSRYFGPFDDDYYRQLKAGALARLQAPCGARIVPLSLSPRGSASWRVDDIPIQGLEYFAIYIYDLMYWPYRDLSTVYRNPVWCEVI